MKKNQKVALLCWFYNTDKWYKIKHLLEPIKDHGLYFVDYFMILVQKKIMMIYQSFVMTLQENCSILIM